ncbi:MAG: hypothetical protein F6K26_02840 [Moorea sp. SIO2I5]|nr:hypothetical protein [Moorena sp. SIO2I5]
MRCKLSSFGGLSAIVPSPVYPSLPFLITITAFPKPLWHDTSLPKTLKHLTQKWAFPLL